MASDIFIPGDALQQASDAMGRVLDHIIKTRGEADLGQVVGRPLRDAAENFEGRWSDGREQLRRECKKIREAIQKIEEGFMDTDNQAADSISKK